VDGITLLVVHPKRSRRSQLQSPLAIRKSLHEIPFIVYKGTATPWDQGPRAVYKEDLFPLVVLASL
jgi:hypothetical protein